MAELREDGRIAAQQQTNIARWYAHAIAQTHQLMDGWKCTFAAGGLSAAGRLVTRLRPTCPAVDVDKAFAGADESILGFLSIDDAHLADNPVAQPPAASCPCWL